MDISKSLFLLVVITAASARGAAQTSDPAERSTAVASASTLQSTVDALVAEEALSRGVPGLAVTIVARGHVLVCCGYGIADVRTGSPVTATTAFNVASVSKPFTAILALRLVERGLLDLDGSVRTWLPWLPETTADITIRQLLHHTSGIVRDVRRDNADDPVFDAYRARIEAAPRSAASGSRWEYSNVGYSVLGFACEAAAGAPMADLLRRELFEPATMRHASYRGPITVGARAQPHQVVGRQPLPVPYVSGGFGSGGLALSAVDFAAFALALRADALVPAARLAEALTPGRLATGDEARCTGMTNEDRYGFGWFLSTFEGRRLATHGGAIQGFSANLYHFPDEVLTIAVVANCKTRDDGAAPVDPLCRRIAKACLADGMLEGVGAHAGSLRAELTKAADTLAGAIANGDATAMGAVHLGADAGRQSFRLQSERPSQHGDIVVDQGSWHELRRDGEQVTARTGRCVNVWRRSDGGWKLVDSARESEPTLTVVSPDAAASDQAVRSAVLDYVEGVYGREVDRVARSVHPTLAKRGYWRERGANVYTSMPMTHEQLLSTTRTYNAERRDMTTASREVTVFDVLDQTASARVVAEWGIDYLHLARIDGRWQIVNVLWQSPPLAR
ncbi:MAG: serine hydrolase [Planctomycetes bacterium]|nr:serine hydrolase [Planctomycetota bacterium]